MPGTEETFRIGYRQRPGAWLYALPAILLVYAVAERSWVAAAWTLLTFAQVYTSRRGVTVLTPTHVETGMLRKRSARWEDVRAIRSSGAHPQAHAVLADGTSFPLKGVLWRAPRVEGHGVPYSVQTVAEWARRHGHDVALVEP